VSAAATVERCGRCVFFVDDPRELERRLTGLTILSSAWGDTRGDQGLCELHHRLLQPAMICRRFVDRTPAGANGSASRR
jgi:hypothetical protein